MYRLSEATINNLEKSFGMSLADFDKMSADEERDWVERKIGRKLSYSKKRQNSGIGVENPLLERRKFRTMDDLDRKSKKLFGI